MRFPYFETPQTMPGVNSLCALAARADDRAFLTSQAVFLTPSHKDRSGLEKDSLRTDPYMLPGEAGRKLPSGTRVWVGLREKTKRAPGQHATSDSPERQAHVLPQPIGADLAGFCFSCFFFLTWLPLKPTQGY